MNISKLLMASLVLVSATAFGASDPAWELAGSSTLAFHSIGTSTSGSSSSSVFFLAVDASKFVLPELQIGGVIGYTHVSGGNLVTATGLATSDLQITVGPTYDFLGVANQAYFATAQVGFHSTSTASTSASSLAYFFGLGKRFGLTDSVCWSPEISYGGYAANDDKGLPGAHDFAVVPIRFSILL